MVTKKAIAFLALLIGATSASAQPVVVKYYHLDGLGNVRAITDSARQVVERHEYLPFGEEWNPQPSGDSRKFTGKERDTETGLDYFGARYYGAEIGRFTTVDPVYNWSANPLDSQRWNRYSYGRNNPLRYVDPNGEDLFDAITGAANAFGSNFFLGAGRATAYNSDFALGQAVGDVASFGFGLFEVNVGTTAAGGGTLVAVTGAGAPVGVPAAAVGAGIAAHGVGVAASALLHLSKAQEGIYEFPDATSEGRTYVGQSGDLSRRLKQHKKTGKLANDSEAETTAVSGGKTAREVEEQRRINQLGGTREVPGSTTSNVTNPIGPGRRAEIEKKFGPVDK